MVGYSFIWQLEPGFTCTSHLCKRSTLHVHIHVHPSTCSIYGVCKGLVHEGVRTKVLPRRGKGGGVPPFHHHQKKKEKKKKEEKRRKKKKKPPDTTSEHLEFKIFLGGHAPRPPYIGGLCPHPPPPPPSSDSLRRTLVRTISLRLPQGLFQ